MSETNGDSIQLSGPQARAVKLLIRSEVRTAVKGAFDEIARGGCLVQCQRMSVVEDRIEVVEETLLGKPDEEAPGLIERLRSVEHVLGNFTRVTWLAIGAAVVSGVAFIAGLFGK